MDHLQAGVQLPFAVLPESSALFEPRKGPFDDPSFGHDGEGVEIASFGDLHCCAELLLHGFGKWFARVSAVRQHAADVLQIVGAAVDCGQGPVAVGHVGRRDGDGMGQSLRVDRDMALDAGDLLARVVALLAGCIGILHALRINDQEAGRAAAPLSGAVLAN